MTCGSHLIRDDFAHLLHISALDTVRNICYLLTREKLPDTIRSDDDTIVIVDDIVPAGETCDGAKASESDHSLA